MERIEEDLGHDPGPVFVEEEKNQYPNCPIGRLGMDEGMNW